MVFPWNNGEPDFEPGFADDEEDDFGWPGHDDCDDYVIEDDDDEDDGDEDDDEDDEDD